MALVATWAKDRQMEIPSLFPLCLYVTPPLKSENLFKKWSLKLNKKIRKGEPMILLPPSSSTLCFLHETSFHSLSGWKHGTWHSLTKESLTFLTHSCNRWDLETNPSQQTRYTSPQAYFSPLCAEEDLRAANMWVHPCNLRNSHDVRYGIRRFRSNLLSLKIYWEKKNVDNFPSAVLFPFLSEARS